MLLFYVVRTSVAQWEIENAISNQDRGRVIPWVIAPAAGR